jgi:hypothetical protein
MKFQKVVAALSLTFVVGVGLARAQTAAPAQSVDAAIEQLRKDTRADKADIISGSMGFTGTQAAAFWPLYKKYEEAQKAVGDEKVALIKDYAAHAGSISESKATEMVGRLQAIEEKALAAKHAFVKSLQSVLPAKQVARYYQVENRIQMLADLALASQIPLVE